MPEARASARSSALAARMRAACARTAAAMAASAAILLRRRRQRQDPARRRARGRPISRHDGGDIAGSFNAFERRAHAESPSRKNPMS